MAVSPPEQDSSSATNEHCENDAKPLWPDFSSPEEKPTGAKNQTPDKKYWHTNDLPMLIVTFLGVIAVIAYTCVSRQQLNVMQGQLDESKRIFTELERPYIFVDTPKFVPSKIEGRHPNVQYILANYGRTPAIVRWLKAIAQTEPPGILTWIEISNKQIIFKSGDEKGVEPNTRMPTPYPTRDPVLRAIEKPPVLLIIDVTYSDVFDYVHCSEFTFFESEGSFYAIGGKKYNRSKSEKLPDGVEWNPAWSEKFCADFPEPP